MFKIVVDRDTINENNIVHKFREVRMRQDLDVANTHIIDTEFEVAFMEAVWSTRYPPTELLVDLGNAVVERVGERLAHKAQDQSVLLIVQSFVDKICDLLRNV